MGPREEEALRAFYYSEDPLKRVASRLKMHPRTLGSLWLNQFGESALRDRTLRMREKGAINFGGRTKGVPKKKTFVETHCDKCGISLELTKGQLAKFREVLCPVCRGKDTKCPVCGLLCKGKNGLSNHLLRWVKDAEHQTYVQDFDEWEGQVEGQDYVVCQVCGDRGKGLTGHIRTHGLTAETYYELYPGHRLRSTSCENHQKEAAKRAQPAKSTAGKKKIIVCPDCGEPREVGWSFAPSTHNPRCLRCRELVKWEGKEEGTDYVVCILCGYRAENLTSHVQNRHPELVGSYLGQIVSLCSAVRDKTALKGKTLSEETKKKMSENAGRWNKGLTKETDFRLANLSESCKGRPSWSKGLTKEDSPGLRSTSEKLKTWVGDKRNWSNGLKVILTEEQLAPFRLKNGKVSVGKAMAVLGYSFITVREECDRLKLSTSHTNVAEHYVMEILAGILGETCVSEWSSSEFTNPETGRRFRYDGFFQGHQLLVEFHGRQHSEPVKFYGGKKTFLQIQKYDAIKAEMVKKHPTLRLLVIHEAEPYGDVDYLTTKLKDFGVV